jgi:hypothetical protein
VLELTLPYVRDPELETLIDQRAAALERQLDAQRPPPQPTGTNTTSNPANKGGRGQLTVQFFEKKRRKGTWLSRGDDEVCWESWTVKVTVSEPRTESGTSHHAFHIIANNYRSPASNQDVERAKVRRAMEQTLQKAAFNIITYVNQHKDHIPPITTQTSNPFPYKINVDQQETGWASRMRIY